MHIFYNCPTGVHTALVAAGIHVGLLPEDNYSEDHIMALPYFNTLAAEGIGLPRYIGHDKNDNAVYTMGVAGQEEMILKAMQSLFEICHIPVDRYHLVGASHYVHPLTQVGCFLNRHGLPDLGQALMKQGLEKNFLRLRDLVNEVKTALNIL